MRKLAEGLSSAATVGLQSHGHQKTQKHDRGCSAPSQLQALHHNTKK